MKKNIIKTIIAGAVISLFFASCHSPIYNTILSEVKPEEYGIKGFITGFAKCDNNLYLSNSKIYVRDLNAVEENCKWTKVPSPSHAGASVIKVASSGNTLFALTGVWAANSGGKNTLTNVKVWSAAGNTSISDSSAWTEVSLTEMKADTTPVLIFSNDAYSAVYLKDDKGNLYNLGTSGVSSEPELELEKDKNAVSGTKFVAGDCVIAEKYCTFPRKSSDSSCVGYYNGSEWEKISIANVGEIVSLGLTSDYLLIGTTSGLYRLELTGDKPSNTPTAFTDNSRTILSASYEVSAIYVANPAASYETNTIFAAILPKASLTGSSYRGVYNETGLYAYYSTRKYWNKDGTADKSSQGN